jgi:hypothetical protein
MEHRQLNVNSSRKVSPFLFSKGVIQRNSKNEFWCNTPRPALFPLAASVQWSAEFLVGQVRIQGDGFLKCFYRPIVFV